MERQKVSKSIDGIGNLVIWAPIREGFIDAFENITYETRLKQTAEALHKVRVSAREHEYIAPFADTAERILSLLNFQIGIVDHDLFLVKHACTNQNGIRSGRYMFLVATFDGPLEPYLRLIWKPLGPFLDLILCNCKGYVTADDHGFDEYLAWIRQHQLEPAIFYSTTGLTVKDQLYLTKLEKMQRDHPADVSEGLIARMISDDPEVLAQAVLTHPDTQADSLRLAFEALTVLFRLADFYPPDRLDEKGEMAGDGRYLLRAAKDLLRPWNPADPAKWPLSNITKQIYREPLDWFNKKRPPSAMPTAAVKFCEENQVQKGLLTGYDQPGELMTHGALLLMQIIDPGRAYSFLRLLEPNWEQGAPSSPDGLATRYPNVFFNLALTFQGLERLLPKGDLDRFPREFRDGMAERAPMIGDVRDNHPRRWPLPARYAPECTRDQPPPVELSEIDIAVQLRTRVVVTNQGGALEQPNDVVTSNKHAQDAKALNCFDEANPLAGLIALIGDCGLEHGVQLVAVEDMFRPDAASDPSASAIKEHFGFRDGLSQPVLVLDDKDELEANEIRIGDLLCGYRNSRGDFPQSIENDFLRNGSFLVVRKMEQHVKEFKDLLDRHPHLGREDLAARLVGRKRDGTPLIQGDNNRFDYSDDLKGKQCPFASHIRLSNPRKPFQGRPTPRILRRGMSYGRRLAEDPDGPRGVVFMAYNASIAEQYEVIQRWLNGGNSTSTAAAQNDPLTGTAGKTRPRVFRCTIDNEVHRIELGKPLVTVEWGAYFFVPSRAALESLTEQRRPVADPSVKEGEALLRKMAMISPQAQRLEWKVLLEDFLAKDPSEKNLSPRLWAAIRARGGAYRVDQGIAFSSARASADGASRPGDEQKVVLVANRDLIMKVLSDDITYSAREQRRRAMNSFGDIYVTQDPHDPQGTYKRESKATNEIIWEYSRTRQQDAYKHAYAIAEQLLNIAKKRAAGQGLSFFELELNRQFFMPVLGKLCTDWFDIPDRDGNIELGGWGWEPFEGVHARKARCPGDFMAPSRYSFYPRPTKTIQDYGISHGKALQKASITVVEKMIARVKEAKAKGCGSHEQVPGKISGPMYQAIVEHGDAKSGADLLARNLIGIMEGMLPPTNGILRGIIYEWLDQKTLWRHQGALRRAAKGPTASFDQAASALRHPVEAAMCKRPSPDLIYRTATTNTKLGNVTIEQGDLVILGLVSATQASLEIGREPDITPIFGGDREDAKHPAHACPAKEMVMASVLGILAALLDSGQIQALPGTLIIRVKNYAVP